MKKKRGELGGPFVMNWGDACRTLEALEELPWKAVRVNKGVSELLEALRAHVRAPLESVG